MVLEKNSNICIAYSEIRNTLQSEQTDRPAYGQTDGWKNNIDLPLKIKAMLAKSLFYSLYRYLQRLKLLETYGALGGCLELYGNIAFACNVIMSACLDLDLPLCRSWNNPQYQHSHDSPTLTLFEVK